MGAVKNIDQDAMKVIGNFLTGRLKYHAPNSNQRTVQVDRIESAFSDQGWRVDRAAIEQALEDMQKPGSIAFTSAAFTQELPIRVDFYKGEEVGKLMAKVGGKAATEGSDSEDDSENAPDTNSENQLFVGQNTKKQRTKPGFANKYGHNFERNLARVMAGHNAAAARNSQDNEEFEFIPEDSLLKGKGPAPRQRTRQQGAENQDYDHIEDDEGRSAPAKRIKSEDIMVPEYSGKSHTDRRGLNVRK